MDFSNNLMRQCGQNLYKLGASIQAKKRISEVIKSTELQLKKISNEIDTIDKHIKHAYKTKAEVLNSIKEELEKQKNAKLEELQIIETKLQIQRTEQEKLENEITQLREQNEKINLKIGLISKKEELEKQKNAKLEELKRAKTELEDLENESNQLKEQGAEMLKYHRILEEQHAELLNQYTLLEEQRINNNNTDLKLTARIGKNGENQNEKSEERAKKWEEWLDKCLEIEKNMDMTYSKQKEIITINFQLDRILEKIARTKKDTEEEIARIEKEEEILETSNAKTNAKEIEQVDVAQEDNLQHGYTANEYQQSNNSNKQVNNPINKKESSLTDELNGRKTKLEKWIEKTKNSLKKVKVKETTEETTKDIDYLDKTIIRYQQEIEEIELILLDAAGENNAQYHYTANDFHQ